MVARLFLVYKNIFCRKIKIQISKKKKGKKVTIVSHTKAATVNTHTHTRTHEIPSVYPWARCVHCFSVCAVAESHAATEPWQGVHFNTIVFKGYIVFSPTGAPPYFQLISWQK